MSDTWVPKVGDRVMVGEHGPYEVTLTRDAGQTAALHVDKPAPTSAAWVPTAWLSPAPEPEPEEPTAPGALVRDGEGRLHTLFVGTPSTTRWFGVTGSGIGREWPKLPRPVTVVLADPAEVEQLRAERDAYRKAKQENDERFQLEAARQRERADELQRRIDYAYRRLSEGPAVKTYQDEVSWREWVAACLSRQGES